MFRQIAFAAGLSMAATAGFAQTAETPAQGGGAAPAQKAPQAARIDPAAAYEAARNQLGILKYCQSQGFSGAEAVSAQQKLVGMLPEGDAQAGAAAELPCSYPGPDRAAGSILDADPLLGELLAQGVRGRVVLLSSRCHVAVEKGLQIAGQLVLGRLLEAERQDLVD